MNTRILVTAGAVALACVHADAATPAAGADPWAKVPALPTVCYGSQDQWLDRQQAALDAVQQAHAAQSEANSAIEQAANKAMQENPMAMAQAMQQAMMSDPQNAQQYMEQMMAQGQQATTEIPGQGEREQQFDAEGEAVKKQYHAALTQAGRAAEARWAALKKKRGYGPEVNMPGETGEPQWVWDEYSAILHDRDAAYVANCAQWWAANSPIHAYLKRYKDYMVQERVPSRKKLLDQPKLDQYKLLNVPTAGFRTTEDYEAAELYLKKAGDLFSERAEKPRCQSADRCDAMF
jgi:hypothetical protein